jgi:hypothetical protein
MSRVAWEARQVEHSVQDDEQESASAVVARQGREEAVEMGGAAVSRAGGFGRRGIS